MDGTRIASAGHPPVRIISAGFAAGLSAGLSAAGRSLMRLLKVIAGPAAAIAVYWFWLAGTVGFIPPLIGFAISGMVLSVLIAWALVKA